MKTKQKYLGENGLITLIVLLSAFIPLSTDLYLPAMPTMSKVLSVNSALVNMTLTMFFIVFGISSYIYIDGFKLSEQSYSFFFAANAVFSIIGPLIYIKISKKLTEHTIITMSFIVSVISGLLICLFGHFHPVLFAMALIPGTLMIGLTRPLGASMIFRQIDGDAGVVSSLMGFSFTIFGFLGMFSAALNLMDNIYLIGIFNFLIAAVGLGLWYYFSKKIDYCTE